MKKIVFYRNKIQYYQDFGFPKGIPSGIEFEIKESGDSWILTADGYGVLGKENKYGNGSLHVYPKDIDVKKIKRLD